MIEAIRIEGREMARCTCDACQSSLDISAVHGTGKSQPKTKMAIMPIKNLTAVAQQLRKNGWKTTGKTILCGKCIEQQKEEKAMAVVEQIRQPTREQKREIMLMLDIAYDTKSGHYKGKNSDKSVAEELGDGILWGWVKEIREEFFGESDKNEEADKAIEEINVWMSDLEKRAAEIHDKIVEVQKELRELNAYRDEIKGIIKKVS